jgi:hypothetical protein
MNKHHLHAQVKSAGTAYLFYFLLLGAHYAYLGRWGLQILFWVTLGGFGIWGFIDLFLMSGKVAKHNATIFSQLEDIERREREADHARNLAMIAAARG